MWLRIVIIGLLFLPQGALSYTYTYVPPSISIFVILLAPKLDTIAAQKGSCFRLMRNNLSWVAPNAERYIVISRYPPYHEIELIREMGLLRGQINYEVITKKKLCNYM